MPISYTTLQTYLTKIAEQADLDASNSGHGVFWNIPYADFIGGNIPSKKCMGNMIPIVDATNRTESAFYKILLGPWCSMPQMPKSGPYVTDAGYSITLDNGSVISGAQISSDIHEWLASGALEHETQLIALGD